MLREAECERHEERTKYEPQFTAEYLLYLENALKEVLGGTFRSVPSACAIQLEIKETTRGPRN